MWLLCINKRIYSIERCHAAVASKKGSVYVSNQKCDFLALGLYYSTLRGVVMLLSLS